MHYLFFENTDNNLLVLRPDPDSAKILIEALMLLA